MKRAILSFLVIILMSDAYSQQAYFADGYHGGIYGHYPMWQTQFMVDKLAQHPEWRINLEIEPETWDSVKVKETSAFNNFRNIAADKRIEFTNPTFAQPYCYNISGESLIRQFEYGIKKIHQYFPDVAFTTYSAEEPCFTSCLPQLLKSFGFKYAVLKNPDTCWGGYTRAYGGELVNWMGPDQTSILTVPRYACEALEDNSTWQTKAWNNSSDYLSACSNYGIKNPVGMCFQDAGWENGPWIGSGNNIHNNSKYITWKDYIENISVGKTSDNWHFTQEDILVNLMWGSQILQRIAQEVRTSENKIVMAEKMASMSSIENKVPYPESRFHKAWRTLLLAQHHDSWIVPYNRLKENRTWADEISLWTNNADTVSDNVIKNAVRNFDDNKGSSDQTGYIRVFNTLGVQRSEIVSVEIPQDLSFENIAVYNVMNKLVPSSLQKDGNISRLVFKANAPSFGYVTYRIQKQDAASKNKSNVKFDASGNCIIENDTYKIVLDRAKGGTIKSLISKKINSKEFIAKDNKFGLGELRGYFYDDNRFYSSSESPVHFTILKDTPLETSVKIEGEIASHPCAQIITIASGQERIDFDLTINWKENVGIGEYKQGDNWRDNRRAFHDDRYKLNVMFPVDLTSPQIYKDAPFDVCESRLDNTFFNTWDSIKHNIILHWVDLVQKDGKYGLALLSDHTTSYSHGEDFPLSLTAQYSGKGLWGPDYKITQPLKIKYAIIPHQGKWDKANISEESNRWNEPLLADYCQTTSLVDKSFIEFDKKGYEITTVKFDDKEILIRLYNAEGDNSSRKMLLDFPVNKIEEVNLNGEIITEKEVRLFSGKHIISVDMPRFGIKTYRIEKKK